MRLWHRVWAVSRRSKTVHFLYHGVSLCGHMTDEPEMIFTNWDSADPDTCAGCLKRLPWIQKNANAVKLK
jgi:hypothetical protein